MINKIRQVERIILGIDPGSLITGYGVVKSSGNHLEFIACGCIRTGGGDFPLRLQTIFNQLQEVVFEYQPQEMAIENVFGRFQATNKTISGVYSATVKNDKEFKKALDLSDKFEAFDGRRPRIMIAKMGQDGHDRGAKVVATGYADVGFDVDIGPLFQTPAEAAKQAVENDVHILGVSSLAAGHKTLVPAVIAELKKYGREDIMVIVGGVIPHQDYQYLFDAGAVAVFGPGTKISDFSCQCRRQCI